MPKLRVLLNFVTAADATLSGLAVGVLEKMYPNTNFPAPPVTQVAFEAATTNFTNAIAAAKKGGPEQTAIKKNCRATLIDQLQRLALYVMEKHENDLATLLSSGFHAVSTKRTSDPLEQPTVRRIVNGNSGELILRCNVIRNARCYEGRCSLIGPDGRAGEWFTIGLFTNTRSISFAGLIPGALYNCGLRAIGGTTGHSDWSDTITHRSL